MAGNSTRINILVEGQTEETFVRELLVPHLSDLEVWATPRIITTGKGHKGGAVSYAKIERQVRIWCQQDPSAKVTTLFDVYGLPTDFPGISAWKANQPAATQVAALEANLANAVAQANFIPYLQLHEYEALLFSDVNAFQYAGVSQAVIDAWQRELDSCGGPEDLNNSQHTAPSKRLIARWPAYAKAKPLYGSLIALQIGLGAMRRRCLRFDAWLSHLETL